MKNSNPIFMTGTYRIGATILSQGLDKNPKLNIAYDSINHFRWFIKKIEGVLKVGSNPNF
jgi:hypothetical protein